MDCPQSCIVVAAPIFIESRQLHVTELSPTERTNEIQARVFSPFTSRPISRLCCFTLGHLDFPAQLALRRSSSCSLFGAVVINYTTQQTVLYLIFSRAFYTIDFHLFRLAVFQNVTRSSAVAVIADRTACSILTLFIVSTTSRPLNKKSVCCQSANPINNYCGSASTNSQSAHLSARVAQATAVAPNGTVPFCSARNAITVYWDSGL